MLGLYSRYDGDSIPIQSRTIADPDKPNNKIPNDFRGYIVNQVVGYLFGKPVAYQIDKLNYSEADYTKYAAQLSHFHILNGIDDLDSELGKVLGTCGYAARLLYIAKSGGDARVMNLFPWESIFIEHKGNITHSIRYYKVKNAKDEGKTRVEWYDSKNVTFFIENNDGEYVADAEGSFAHLFDDVPMVLFQNNDEEKGDFEKVEPLIDAYDKITSDGVNEVETFANAYMGFSGVEIDKDVIKAMKQSGGIGLGEDGKAFFITKDINDTFVENNKKTLKENIHKFSASVDMADENFSGANQSGESRKWKLIDLENKAGTKSRKFGKGLREQYRVLCTAWNKTMSLDYLDIFWDFKRNLPIDLLYIGEFAGKLKGIHSDRTLMAQIPYIEDVDYEKRLMQEEKEGLVDLDNLDDDE
ncbi:hypothetical protein AWH48_12080 [Domibacillus aminovorans]|uniref:Portal protein n=2 Tax=Domibacillus aminovorans TaxID=29332 RepID=A0A177KK05_9BACI|nr:hypothetical protein AWH48_12080 [Domibacillus aminovorans]